MTIKVKDFDAATKLVRQHLNKCINAAYSANMNEAYSEAEAAQFAAFDLKKLIADGSMEH